MSFLNPLLLFGMAAIVAPIVIHLFMNRKVKPVVWAAMRFLKVSMQKNQKRMNLEDLLLLLLRCLLFILLALTLARPIFRGSANAVVAKGSEIAVLVVDNSYSMGQSDGGTTRFDRAREAATQVIDGLPQGSSAAVLFFSNVVRAAVPEPSYDLNLVRKVISDGALSDRTTDVLQAIKQAKEVISRQTSGSGEAHIYVISDGQASGWKQFSDISKDLHDPELKSTVIIVGNDETRNLGVSDLRMSSAIATVGDAAQFDVEVTNYGTADAKDVAVRLNIDEEDPTDEGVIDSIPPGGSKRLALFTKFRNAGYHTVTARINPDHLPADDQRTIALNAMDDIRVLLVSGDQGTAEPSQNAVFYLRQALTPVPPSERDNYYIKTKTISPGELDTTSLSDYEAVVLANVSNISQQAVDAFGSYLNRGGGLIVFPGNNTNAQFYNDILAKKAGYLPATFGAQRGKPDKQDTYLTLQAKGYDNEIVSIWNDPNAGSLATTHFYCAYELKPQSGHNDQAGEPQVVVKYSDGTPAIMERNWGRGHVIMFSSSANTAWNDMPLRPIFLPFVERTLGSILDEQTARLNLPVGSQFEFVCNPEWVNKDAIITFEGEKKEAGSLRRVTLVDGVPLLRFDGTERAGAYDATVKTDPPTVIKFATQSDPGESKLASLPQSQFDSLSPGVQVVRWVPHMHLDQIASKERGGSEIWTILAMLVLVTACVEVTLAGLFSASK